MWAELLRRPLHSLRVFILSRRHCKALGSEAGSSLFATEDAGRSKSYALTIGTTVVDMIKELQGGPDMILTLRTMIGLSVSDD
jgi:hypothetical protein